MGRIIPLGLSSWPITEIPQLDKNDSVEHLLPMNLTQENLKIQYCGGLGQMELLERLQSKRVMRKRSGLADQAFSLLPKYSTF